MNEHSSPNLIVDLPGHPALVRVLRTMAAREADLTGVGYDTLEDLGLAVDEAAAALMSTGAGGNLRTVFEHSTRSVGFTMSANQAVSAWPPPDWEDSVGGLVLGSVADSVEFSTDSGRPTIAVQLSADRG